MRSLLPLFVLLLTSCSVYKSSVRRQFEDNAPDVVTKSLPGDCRPVGIVQAWLDRELPRGPSELLFADTDLEIWKVDLADGRVLLRADRETAHQSESCTMDFADEGAWRANRRAYLEFFGISSLD